QFVGNWPGFGASDKALVEARIYRKAGFVHVPHQPPPILTDESATLIALAGSSQHSPDPFLLFTLPQFAPVAPQLSAPFPEPKASPSITLLPASEDRKDQKRGEISGQVFDDANGDGVHEAGEVGLAGQRVFLDLNC